MKKRVLTLAMVALGVALVVILAVAPVALAGTGAEDPGGWTVQANQLWGLLVSAIVPFVTGLLVRRSWARWLKALIAFVLSAVVGVATVYLSGEWSGGALAIVLACYGAAQFVFWTVVDQVPGLKPWLLGHFNAESRT